MNDERKTFAEAAGIDPAKVPAPGRKPKTPPTYGEVYILRTTEADELVAALQAKGYRASRDMTGMCSKTAEGEHIHYSGVVLQVTPAQARRLAGIKDTP